MELKVDRKWKKANYCIGNLYINGMWFCNTAEDTDRGLTSDMTEAEIQKIKVKDHTAIPTGKYEITLNVISPRLGNKPFYKQFANGGRVPRFVGLKGFTGVLIHCGNYPDPDSSGCLLVGMNKVKGGVTQSQETFKKLYAILSAANRKGEKITIEIV